MEKKFKRLFVGAALCSLLIAPLLLNAEETLTTEQSSKQQADFGVGQGIQWEDQVVAPFVDMTAYSSKEDLSSNGALDLAAVAKKTGQKFFNLGFMQAKGVKNDRIDWAWGGFNGLSESDNDQWQYEGIKKSIRELRGIGGDVAISFGGLNSGAFWETTQDISISANSYTEIIQGYGLTRVDFDVEAAAIGYQENLANAKAIRKVQEKTGVEVTLTLPVMDTGLISTGLSVLQAYLEAGVELTTVNLMTMCYGSVVPDYAQGSLDAVDNTMVQLKDYYKRFTNTMLTDEQAYARLGTTPSIGFESEAHPYFTTAMLNKVIQHAKEKKIGMVSYWSMNRDAMVDGGQGKVKNQYEFLTVAQQFGKDTPSPEDFEKPSTPTDLHGVASSDSISLSWTASTDNVQVSHYNIYEENRLVGTSKVPNFLHKGLKPATTYSYTVEAVDTEGNKSERSAILSLKTNDETEGQLPVPSVPLQLTAKNILQNKLTLTWVKNTPNEQVMHYAIYRDGIRIGVSETNEFEDNNLDADTTYIYQVKAINQSGSSDFSQAITVKTLDEDSQGNTWTTNQAYSIGSIVTYGGSSYRCLQAHISIAGWTPDIVPALWEKIS